MDPNVAGSSPVDRPSFFWEVPIAPFEALLLGLLQGIAEFFPISSSTHLKMAKKLLGLEESGGDLFFDLLCHSGTLLALLWHLRQEVWQILKSLKKIALFALALAPLVPGYLILKPFRTADPSYLPFSLFATSALLFLASRKKEAVNPPSKWRDVLCIGSMQAMALIPGISRSGSTVAAARLCGWSWKEAASFSFLLAIPTVLGGQLLETVQLLRHPIEGGVGLGWECYAIGFFASLITGLFTVRLAFSAYEKWGLLPFAWYCMGAGCFAWMLFRG